MSLPRWSNVLHRITTAGPYVNEKLSIIVLTSVVVAGVAAVAYADKSVTSFSLVPLYFLPLAVSGLVHPLRIRIALSIVCLALHHLLNPLRDAGIQHLRGDATILLGYIFAVTIVNRLGTQRRRFADLVARQRDELGNELHLAASSSEFSSIDAYGADLDHPTTFRRARGNAAQVRRRCTFPYAFPRSRFSVRTAHPPAVLR